MNNEIVVEIIKRISQLEVRIEKLEQRIGDLTGVEEIVLVPNEDNQIIIE